MNAPADERVLGKRCVFAWLVWMAFVGAVLGLARAPVWAQYEPNYVDTGTVGLGLAIRRLQTTSSLLYITAHPDDEDSGLLARLSRGEGKRVATLTLTRGEGGQNEVGPELFDALGILRTEELLAVHRLDGVRQYFGRVVDFGYSFSVEETFEKWGYEETVGDIVRVIREFRPDVIVTLVPDGAGGGQHHQASARMSTEAYEAAADPKRFPEHLEQGLRPWAAKKLYRAHWGSRAKESAGDKGVDVSIGDFDPLLGLSYAEFGALARNLHRSQGMNAPPQPGHQTRVYSLAQSRVEARPDDSLFGALPETLFEQLAPVLKDVANVSAGEALWRMADLADGAFTNGDFALVASLAMTGLQETRRILEAIESSSLEVGAKAQARFIMEREETDWEHAAATAHQLYGDAVVTAEDGLVVPGEEMKVEARLVNRGQAEIDIVDVRMEAPAGWRVRAQAKNEGLSYNETSQARFQVDVDPQAKPTEPFFRRDNVRDSRYVGEVPPDLQAEPFAPPLLHVVWTYRSKGVEATLRTPVVHRWYDPAVARRRSYAVKVVPRLTVRMTPQQSVVPLAADGRSRPVEVHLVAHTPLSGVVVRLQVPEGWRAEPASATVDIERQNEAAAVQFRLHPPPVVKAGAYPARAIAEEGGRLYKRGYQSVAYHHVETRHHYRPALATVQFVDVKLPGNWQVGYVMGVGDEVASAITALGATVQMLDAEALAVGDLSKFNAIVTGVRAYKDRQDLIANNHRLLDYVHGGGVLIVQYNKYEFNRDQYGPYPSHIARPHDRVTDENAAVQILQPDHPVFLHPNRLTSDDWDGWVQERGLYFWATWDEKYTPLLAMEDSFPYNRGVKKGAMLIARYGRGQYVYTGLGLFRQLPAGVPGAYRLLANLLSLQEPK